MSPQNTTETWAAYTPPTWRPDESTARRGGPVAEAAIRAIMQADLDNEAHGQAIAGDADTTATGMAKRFARDRAIPVLKQIESERMRLRLDKEGDFKAVEGVRTKATTALSAEMTPLHREYLQVFRSLSAQQQTSAINDAVGGRKPELLQALAVADTMLSGISAEQRFALRDQVARASLAPEDGRLLETLKEKDRGRAAVHRYLDAVAARTIAASDRSVLEAAGVAGKSVTQMTAGEKNALLARPDGLEKFERMLAGLE